MRDLCFHSPGVSLKESASSRFGKSASGSGSHEVAFGQLSAVECADGYRVGDQRTERLHQVECQSGTAWARNVEGADHRLQTRLAQRGDAVIHQHGIGK